MIMPFAGLRYNTRLVADLGAVMTPPYDVISAAERAAYMRRSPYSMIHLILGAEYDTDTLGENRFTRAAALLRQWRRDGILVQEARPALYLYRQEFTLHGETITRTGLIGRVRLAAYDEKVILPHEQTFAGPKADLLRLWGECQANLSQIFSLYLDPEHTLESIWEPLLQRPADIVVPHWMEGQHRLWVVTDPAMIAPIQQFMCNRPLVIADGHHRYETALALRDTLRQQHAGNHTAAPSAYVAMYCANMHDPGVVALPTHRLVRQLPVAQLQSFLTRLDWLTAEAHIRQSGEDLVQWQRRLEVLLRQRQAHGSVFALYTGGDQVSVVTVPPEVAAQRVQIAGASKAWKQLDVSVLHHALLPALQAMQPAAQPVVAYARQGDAVLQEVAQGAYDLACLMNPTPLQSMATIAMGGERLPQKSTYFYPKLPTGLVLNSFEV